MVEKMENSKMKNHNTTGPAGRIFLLVSIAVLCCFSPISAQKSDQTVNFNTPSIDLVFQPPMRSGLSSPNPLNIEVPRLNLAVNLIENYIQYLARLQKIATGTRISMVYAPGVAVEDWNEDSRTTRLIEPGLNQTLQQVNQFLRENERTDKDYLLENADMLFTIPDNYPRKTSKIAIKTELINHSSFQQSLEPDTDFCVVDNNRVVTVRPYKRSNRLFIMTDSNNVCSSSLLLEQSQDWYANLSASSDGRFLALTDGLRPMVMPFSSGRPQRLFPDNNQAVMMSMRWAPGKPLLAGMILDNSTQERQLFIYDADQGKMLDISCEKGELPANYLNAFPYWSPDGSRLIFTSACNIHLIDLAQGRFYPDILRMPNEVGEVIWSDDSQSFALLEVIGQARNRYLFDDLDYRKTVLHRYRIGSDLSVNEDHAQRVESRNTIKLVSFWTNDRVLYLEGRLMSKRLNTPYWDLTKTFNAYLTPAPTAAASRDKPVSHAQTSPQLIPMQYLYVFRNLDGKYVNVYDAGFGHTNQIFTDTVTNIWFIGLRRPEEVVQRNNVYSLRLHPYPFGENNVSVFSDIGATRMELLLKFLQDYNLRAIRLNDDITRLFMLANFSGVMNLWSGELLKVVEGLNQVEE